RRNARRRPDDRRAEERPERPRGPVVSSGGEHRRARHRRARDRLDRASVRASPAPWCAGCMKSLAYRLVAVVAISAALAFATDVFLTSANLLNVLRQASLTFLIASGLTLTILTAGLDLSVGANVGLSACLAATAMKSSGSIAIGV